MSYNRLNHESQSNYVVTQHRSSRSPPLHKVTTYESESDDSSLEDLGGFEGQHDFELKDLNATNRLDQPKADADLQESYSSDGDQSTFMRARIGGTSNVQTAKLYTSDEERIVRRKFDRRLVLFVAFLYMLSFLDRSSTYPSFPNLRDISLQERCM